MPLIIMAELVISYVQDKLYFKWRLQIVEPNKQPFRICENYEIRHMINNVEWTESRQLVFHY